MSLRFLTFRALHPVPVLWKAYFSRPTTSVANASGPIVVEGLPDGNPWMLYHTHSVWFYKYIYV